MTAEFEKFAMTIGGERSCTATYREVLNPSDHSVVGLTPVGSGDDLDAAIAAARSAQKTWAAQGNDAWRKACLDMAEVLSANAPELARLLTLEQGKPLKGMGSEFELGGCAGWAGYQASLELPVEVLQDDAAATAELHRVPVGVVGSITPWNWPLMIAIWHVAPAIRTGNTAVIKPSPYTPLSTLRMVEILNTVLPEGVLNSVSGTDDIGAAMAGHTGIDKIVFTGSIATGKKVMRLASPTLKDLTLELGGNDPGIVLDDADPETIAGGLFWGAFINSGQTCAAMKRLYVPDRLYDDVCAQLVALAKNTPMGDGLDTNNVLGPVQNKRQLAHVSALVESAKKDGAEVLTGGAPTGQGYFYPTTLIANAHDGMRIVDEEQFGPVLPIIRYSKLDDAISAANSLDYGLAASVWSQDTQRAKAVALRLEAGTVYVNKHGEVAPHLPFGGHKSSGLGVEFGVDGLKAYTDIKVLNVANG